MSDLSIQVNKDIRGGLDTNSDEPNISGGNYPDRVNVVRNNDGSYGSETGELGTTVAYEIPDIALQNQRVRIYLDDSFFSAKLTLKNVAGQIIKETSFNSSPSIASNKQSIVNVITGWALGATFYNTLATDPDYIDVELDFFYSDFALTLISAPAVGPNVDYKVVVIREAISITGSGEAYLVGSCQTNSLEFRCYTTQNRIRSRDKDVDFIENFQSKVLVRIPAHGLVTNESIILARLSGAASFLNAEWTVTVLDENTFFINGADPSSLEFFPVNYGGFFYKNPYGYSFVLVQTYRSSENIYTYSIPLRSKKINWNTLFQVDIDVLFFNNVYALYPTDFYNRPYVFYFNDPVSDDSGIEALNEDGRYSYEELAFQIIRHKDNNTSFVTIGEQQQSGGNLKSASYRYGTVLRTADGSETEISDLSAIVSVYEPVFNGVNNIFGTLGQTNKVNRIIVNDIPPGIYQFIDLVAVIIVGQESNTTATETVIVSSTQLGPDQTSIELEHSGNEIDTRFFDLGKLNAVRTTPLKIKTNRLGENRLFEGNYITSARFDITEWAKTVRYGITKVPVFSDFGAENRLSFASPFVKEVGYQIFEWYRFYIVGEFIEGGLTDATFAVDIRFVSQQDYLDSFGTDDDYRFLESNETDRRDFGIDDFVNYDLGQGNREYFQFGLNISIDWDFQIGGVSARNVFKRIKICRAERVKEVLSTGISAPSKQMATEDFPSGGNLQCFVSEAVIGDQYNEWNKAKRVFQGTVIPISELEFSEFDDNLERVVTYYSPDLLFKSEGDVVGASDYFIRIGSQNKNTQVPVTPTPSGSAWRTFDCAWDIYDGRLGSQTTSSKHLITSSFTCDIGELVPLPENDAIDNEFEGVPVLFTKRFLEFFTIPNNSTPEPNGLLPIYLAGNRFSSRVYFLDTKLPQTTSSFWGVHNTIRFRSIKNKYGITSSSIDVLYTGYDLFPSQTQSIVWGGDVYTQQTWFRQTLERLGYPISGGGIGFNIISQNTLNTQLKVVDITNTTNPSFPTPTPFDIWIKSQFPDQRVRNSAYQQILNQQYLPVFDPNALDRNNFPTRIRWSESTPNGAVKDFNTIFLPGAFRDNPLGFGEIEMLDFKQGELFTLQQLCYTREFVNNYGRLSTLEDGNVTIGDASVLARDGIRLTQLGSKHRWSYGRGLTDAGNDVRLWVNSDFFVVMRAGADGSVNLTTRTMMDTFMRKYMRYVSDKYAPANGQGIHTVWDNRSKRFIITARGWKATEPLSTGIGYDQGDEVNYGNTFSIPQIYVCLVPHISDEDNLPGTPLGDQYWEKISLKNELYYSVWTLAFNESNNRFTELLEYYPKIYSNHFDRYFSQNPYEGEARQHCIHRDGEPLVFYGREHEGYSEYVINYQEDIYKKFISVTQSAILKPYKVEFKTIFLTPAGIEERFTRLDRDEFTLRENGYWSPIKMTLNAQGQNNRRTKDMRGLWIRVKTFFKAREYQKINNIFVAIRLTIPIVKKP